MCIKLSEHLYLSLSIPLLCIFLYLIYIGKKWCQFEWSATFICFLLTIFIKTVCDASQKSDVVQSFSLSVSISLSLCALIWFSNIIKEPKSIYLKMTSLQAVDKYVNYMWKFQINLFESYAWAREYCICVRVNRHSMKNI